ncbi:MAG: hypothetical protein M0P36_11115 [Bacteroidales bacterium]|nr:hypothetical protein [Bacteroidales bacterium]
MKEIFANKYVKIGLLVAIVIVVIVIISQIVKLLKKQDSLTRGARRDTDKDKLSYTDTEYKIMAENLFEAMNGIGTDEDSIYTTLSKLKSQADWFKLIDVYGVREHSQSSYMGFWSFTGNLIESLNNELSSSEKARVSSILASIGVVF